jgi:hypothetical protein
MKIFKDKTNLAPAKQKYDKVGAFERKYDMALISHHSKPFLYDRFYQITNILFIL